MPKKRIEHRVSGIKIQTLGPQGSHLRFDSWEAGNFHAATLRAGRRGR